MFLEVSLWHLQNIFAPKKENGSLFCIHPPGFLQSLCISLQSSLCLPTLGLPADGATVEADQALFSSLPDVAALWWQKERVRGV